MSFQSFVIRHSDFVIRHSSGSVCQTVFLSPRIASEFDMQSDNALLKPAFVTVADWSEQYFRQNRDANIGHSFVSLVRLFGEMAAVSDAPDAEQSGRLLSLNERAEAYIQRFVRGDLAGESLSTLPDRVRTCASTTWDMCRRWETRAGIANPMSAARSANAAPWKVLPSGSAAAPTSPPCATKRISLAAATLAGFRRTNTAAAEGNAAEWKRFGSS
jgi:hypothetical protein